MIIKKYEIDILDVGAADACLIHFYDENDNPYVVLIDGGNYSDGKTIHNFIRNRYNRWRIDLAIVSHCDNDHYGGILYLLEQMDKSPRTCIDINELWVNDPGKHVSVEDVKRYRIQENAEKEARSVFTLRNGKNFFDVLDKVKDRITVKEAFSDSVFEKYENHIEVLGPTKTFYEELAFSFRNKLEPVEDTINESAEEVVFSSAGQVTSKTLDESNDDPSSHNQSSILTVFRTDDDGGNTFFFPGDAGREAFSRMYNCDKDKIKDVTFLKVPHHGSRGNMNSDMINWINPKIGVVSTESYGHYLDELVVKVLKKKGAYLVSTHQSGNIWYHVGTPNRSDYGPISTPL